MKREVWIVSYYDPEEDRSKDEIVFREEMKKIIERVGEENVYGCRFLDEVETENR